MQVDRQRIGLIIGVLAGVMVLGMVVIFAVRSLVYSAKLQLTIAPTGATVILDGKQIKAENQDIKPGEHTLRVEHDGFIAEEQQFSVAKNETYSVLIALVPEDDNADYYLYNERDQIIRDGKITQRQDQAMREAYESDPIMKILPYTDMSSGVTFVVEASYNNGIELLIRLNTCSDEAAEIYKNKALLWIAGQGFRPENYPIKYMTLCD
ncbi:MAG: PEGA domain-containing protein [Candidatus Nomurabacteria bacterium]|jgi:hypothetical protein|nr:PEGA domain-containing protein [Candidatus Nomurabacteria bacterium]